MQLVQLYRFIQPCKLDTHHIEEMTFPMQNEG
jgi:hypothetical protein